MCDEDEWAEGTTSFFDGFKAAGEGVMSTRKRSAEIHRQALESRMTNGRSRELEKAINIQKAKDSIAAAVLRRASAKEVDTVSKAISRKNHSLSRPTGAAGEECNDRDDMNKLVKNRKEKSRKKNSKKESRKKRK